ncbi:MAG TPA: plasmid replication initiator TrfA [Noviherbaspirillum sp.]|nr:plasmid replication initiator TrfA [Noviherbaspirillum sp.]
MIAAVEADPKYVPADYPDDAATVKDDTGWLAAAKVMRPYAAASVLPNVLARCSMFAARTGRGRDGKVVYTKQTQLVAYRNYKITQQSGLQLTQDHLDIWLQLVKASFDLPLEESSKTVTVSITLRQLLGAIRPGSIGGTDAEWLHQRLAELRAATYIFEDDSGNKCITGLVHEVRSERNGEGKYEVLLNSKLRNLFEQGWQTISLSQRQALYGRTAANVLAQWLHTFYSTHRNPVPLKSSTIQQMCGRVDMDSSKFRKLLKEALDLLNKRIPNWKCSFDPSTGLVTVRKGSESPNPKTAGTPDKQSVGRTTPTTVAANASSTSTLTPEQVEHNAFAKFQAGLGVPRMKELLHEWEVTIPKNATDNVVRGLFQELHRTVSVAELDAKLEEIMESEI